MSALRANPSWNLLLTGGTISTVGDFVFDTTMVLWIGTVIAKGQSWAPIAVSGVLIAAAIALLALVVAVLNPLLCPAHGPAQAAEPEATAPDPGLPEEA